MVSQNIIDCNDGEYNLPSKPPIVMALAAGDTFGAATAYITAGLSVIPVRTDGSKAPLLPGWREYAERPPSAAELYRWFGSGRAAGIGIPGGQASGNLAVLDFETAGVYTAWLALLSSSELAALSRSPVVRTPSGGVHVYVRLHEPVKGCRYARTAAGKCLIEVRGCQHFVVAPGSPLTCHPTGKPYMLEHLGWLDNGYSEPLGFDVYDQLTAHAVSLNEYRRPARREVVGNRVTVATGNRPGDDFEVRVAWSDILIPRGWEVYTATEEVTSWTRPGKNTGVSASTGHCRTESGNDLMYVFSTAATPLEADKAYTRFAVYTLLHHHGDFAAAARALARAGYGASRKGVQS